MLNAVMDEKRQISIFRCSFNRPFLKDDTIMTSIIKRRKITVNPAIFHTRHETFIPLSPSFFGFMTSKKLGERGMNVSCLV